MESVKLQRNAGASEMAGPPAPTAGSAWRDPMVSDAARLAKPSARPRRSRLHPPAQLLAVHVARDLNAVAEGVVIMIAPAFEGSRSEISTATNARAGSCRTGLRSSLPCHQRSFQAGCPDRRDSSTQLQLCSLRCASQRAMWCGCCRLMRAIIAHGERPGEYGHQTTVTSLVVSRRDGLAEAFRVFVASLLQAACAPPARRHP